MPFIYTRNYNDLYYKERLIGVVFQPATIAYVIILFGGQQKQQQRSDSNNCPERNSGVCQHHRGPQFGHLETPRKSQHSIGSR